MTIEEPGARIQESGGHTSSTIALLTPGSWILAPLNYLSPIPAAVSPITVVPIGMAVVAVAGRSPVIASTVVPWTVPTRARAIKDRHWYWETDPPSGFCRRLGKQAHRKYKPQDQNEFFHSVIMGKDEQAGFLVTCNLQPYLMHQKIAQQRLGDCPKIVLVLVFVVVLVLETVWLSVFDLPLTRSVTRSARQPQSAAQSRGRGRRRVRGRFLGQMLPFVDGVPHVVHRTVCLICSRHSIGTVWRPV